MDPPPKTKKVSIKVTKVPDMVRDLQDVTQERFKVETTPASWILPNRTKFSNWLDVTFKFQNKASIKKETIKVACDCEEGDATTCTAKVTALRLFPHQQFVTDYMQFASPYRGLLLYHSLGSGKTASAVAAAEVLANHMKVCVMTPASLRGNFIEEIKKYGKYYYSPNQKWTFVPLKQDDDFTERMSELSAVNMSFIKKQKGLWIPHGVQGEDFHQLPDAQKKQVLEQIEHAINNRVQFVNYNGIQKQHIAIMTENGSMNPFDNTCVVIDEIHNLISRVVNKRIIGKAIYKLLYQAKNCKLILLSGTPIINYPHEIAAIINLITGPRKHYEVKLTKQDLETINLEKLKLLFEQSLYIDRYAIESKTISWEFLPEGFEYSSVRPKVIRSKTVVSHKDALSMVMKDLKAAGLKSEKKVTTRDGFALPDDEEDFNKLFVNEMKGDIVNQDIFMRRIMGTVSFYHTFSPELFPEVRVEHIKLPLTDYQFSVYDKSRGEERRRELRAKKDKGGGGDSLFKSTGQVYRFYSRANCNFVFPESIKRPFPTSTNVMKNEVDTNENDLSFDNHDDDEEDEKGKSAVEMKSRKQMVLEYQNKLTEALQALDANRTTYLTVDELRKLYSPKFAEIVEKLKDCPGTGLVYSQFRTVEGLGILGMALKTIGWAELKLKKNHAGTWDLDLADEDINKPLYAMFTGNNEESKVILKIFNGDFETVPESIVNKLVRNRNNLRGDVLKTIMITQSGAEGISLKNVRQVHVVEPYWNHIRIDQVIGRAVRTCSHIALPPKDRNVTVYLYRSLFSTKQLENSFSLRRQDHSMTSDEYIYDIAERKSQIIKKLLHLVQTTSVDCVLNAKYHKDLKCFSFPVDTQSEGFSYEFNVARDQPLRPSRAHEWIGQVLVTRKGQFLIRTETNEVYDYDAYLEAGRLIKIGVIETSEDGKRRTIKVTH